MCSPRKNTLKQRLAKGQVLIGTILFEYRSPGTGQLFASAGFDWLFIDSEHSTFSIETIHSLLVSCRAADIDTVVRVPSKNCLHWITRYMDMGVKSLLVPHVETAQEVKRIVEATKYHPLGKRGMALGLSHNDYQLFGKPPEVMKWENKETLIGIQVESVTAAQRVSDLISIQGIDFVFVGPWDFSQSLGKPGELENPKLTEAVRKVVEICQKHHIATGIAAGNSIDRAKMWIKEGMQLITVSNDIGLIIESGKRYTKELSKFTAGNR